MTKGSRSMRRVAGACALLVTLCVAVSARGDALVIAENGQCDYQIVTPDDLPDQVIGQYLHQTARLLQRAFKESGCDLAIVKEGERARDKPCIYLGDTEFARAHGCDPGTLEGWNYFHKVVGRDCIIAGKDHAPPTPPPGATGSGSRFYYRQGTFKAAADFLRQYTGTYFLYPGRNGLPTQENTGVRDWELDSPAIQYTANETIAIPADLDLHKGVFTRFHTAKGPTLYHLANNFFPKVDDALLGHTYGRAIPVEKYRETNPEYFALVGGERVRDDQYCLSNPDVRELIYEFTASYLEAGFQSVNILQPDGFRRCQCDDCHELYGTGSDWGEKLWIFHRNIAERLKKNYPGRKLLISPYTVTLDPPKSFERFPDNVIIMHVDANFEETEKWRKWRRLHKGEYAIWLHNWIACQTSRYTPQRTPLFIEKQVRFFHDYKVRGAFRDGYTYLYGIEGPTYYIFGRMLDDPEHLTAKELMLEYCEAAFGDAAAPMRRFYDTLFNSIELYSLYLNTHAVGWTFHDIYGRRHKAVQNPFRMLGFLYPPETIDDLEKYLSQAEARAQGENVKARLRLARREFGYLKTLMRVVDLHRAYAKEPTLTSRDRVLDAVDARNAYIKGMYTYIASRDKGTSRYDRAKPIEGWSRVLFPPPGHNSQHLKNPQTYGNYFADTAVNWDTDAMRKAPLPGAERLDAIPAAGEADLDSERWQEAPDARLQPVNPGDTVRSATTVRVMYGPHAVHVRFRAELTGGRSTFPDVGRDGDLSDRESLAVYLGPLPARDVYYRFTVGPNPGSKFDAARGLITDVMNLRYNRDDPDWDGEWQYTSRVDEGEGVWIALLTIPYTTLGTERPGEGTTWRANFGRTHVLGPNRIERAIWSSIGGASDVGNLNSLGAIAFKTAAQARADAAPAEAPLTRWRREEFANTFEIPPRWRDLPNVQRLEDWRFRLDLLEKGVEEKWYLPGTEAADWEPIDVPAFWDEFKYGRYAGAAWYRMKFDVPADWKGRTVRLLFGSVDEQAWVYVNGELVGEHSTESTGKDIGSLWEEPFEVVIPAETLKFGESNVLVVRVHNSAAGGGIWRPVLLHRQ